MGDTPSAKITIQCPCGAALAVPASRAGARVACPKCGTHHIIPAAAPLPAVPPPAGWYVGRDRKKTGPYTASQLRQMAAAGELAPEDMVLRDGQKQWVAADTIKGLFPDAPPPPPPLPPTPSRRKAPAAARSSEKAGPPWLLIGIGGVVLLAAGIGAGVFLATRGSGTPTTQVAEGPKPAPTPDPVKEKTPDDRGKEKTADDRGKEKTPDDRGKEKTPDDSGKEKTPDDRGKEKTPDDSGSVPTPPPPPDQGTPKPPPPPPDTTPGTVKLPVAPAVGQRALDLRFVPVEVGAAVVVHPARILQSPLVKAAVPTAAADEMLKELGIRPEQIEQALVLLSPGPLVPPGATPPPPKDSWVELDSKEGRFALRFPAKPKQSERKTLLGTRQVHSAEVESAGLLFEIAYVDFPADSPIVGALSRVDFGTRALEFKPGFKNKKDLKLGSALGAEVVIDDTQLKTFSVHRVYVVGDRLYHLEATTRKGQAAPPEFERFFSSLRLPGAEAPSAAEMLPPELMPAPAAIVRFTEAIDAKPLLEKLLRGARPAKHEGKDYLVGSEKEGILGIPVAGAQPDDRTVLLAPEPLLKKMLTAGDAKSPLLDSLRTADGSDDLTVWIHPAPFRKALALVGKPAGAMLPPPLAGAATLPERLASLKLTANLRGKTLLQLTLDAEDAASAPAVEKLVQAGQDLLQKLAPSLEPLLSAPGMPKTVQKELLAISEQLASGLERTRSDRRVQLTLSRPARKAAGPLVTAFKQYLPQGVKDEVDLGGEVAAVEAGGGGRYLVYHLKAAKRLALFDVQQGKVVKQLPVLEEPMFFAANARQLAVLYPVRKLLTLRDLDAPDTPKNLTLPAPLSTSEIGHVCMGSASAGPLFCYLPGSKSTVALDLAKVTVRPVQWAKWGPHNAYGPLSMRVSADGRSLLGWGGGWAGLALTRFDNGRQVPAAGSFAFSLGLFANINADGQMVFYPDAVASGPDLQVAKAPPNHYLMPAAESGFYLGLDCGSLPLALPLGGERKYPGVSKVTIFADNRAELLTLTDLPELKEEAKVPWEKSVYYFPRGGLIVTLDKTKVVLRRLDLVERLKKTEVDYLFVMTQPATAKPGTPFTHRLDIRARKDEGRQVKLVTGPEGLQVSADGVLSWAVPAEFAEEEATALVSIRDASGQEILHPQRIRITDE